MNLPSVAQDLALKKLTGAPQDQKPNYNWRDIIRENDLLMGKVDFGGVCKRVCLETVPDIAIGDYALVHVGFAIARIDEEEARRVFALLEEMGDIDELKG